MLDAALAYAARGIRVFPVAPKGKTPLRGIMWKDQATCDPEVIQDWWQEYPQANIGAPMGDGCPLGVAVDIDDPESINELPVAPTLMAQTGSGGWHCFYSGANHLKNKVKIVRGVDIRSTGGYVVLPPSRHKSGNTYRWVDDSEPVAPMPAELVALLEGKKTKEAPQDESSTAYGLSALADECAQLRKVEEGGRNDALNLAAFKMGQLIGSGDLTRSEVTHQLTQAALSIGLDLGEVGATINSGLRSGTQAPRERKQEGRGSRLVAPTGDVQWMEPYPLSGSTPVPRFPLDCLPMWLAQWVEAVAESTQTAPDMAAMLGLAMCAAALAKKAEVKVKDGWAEPLNLWIVVCMGVSERKSPVFSQAVAPIQDVESQRLAEAAEDIAHAEAHLAVLKGQLQVMQASAKKAAPEEVEERVKELAEQRLKIDAVDVPRPDRLVADNVTPEALVSLMAENSGRIAITSDEGGIFQMLAGRYSGSVDLDAVLKAYTGTQIRVDRKKRAAEFVDSPALTMALTVQPQVLREAAQNSAMVGRGLLARPLYCVPDSMLGRRRSAVSTASVPELVRREYEARVRGLLSVPMPPRDGSPTVLAMDPDARWELEGFDQWMEGQLEDGMLSGVAPWAGKLLGTTARLAGILHYARGRHGFSVSIEEVSDAVAIARYAIAHAIEAFGFMSSDEVRVMASKIWKRLCKWGKQSVRWRDLQQSFKKSAELDELEAGMSLLVRFGYARTASESPRSYDLNPCLGANGGQWGSDGGAMGATK